MAIGDGHSEALLRTHGTVRSGRYRLTLRRHGHVLARRTVIVR
jgi:hypothetical protein